MLRLCNVPTIKQTWPWQISFESPFTKRSTTTCLQVQKHPSITWGKRFPVQTRCWSPNPQHLWVKSVSQPLFFLFFCQSVRSRSHARSDKASNLSGPKIYSNLPYPKCFHIDVVCYQVKQQSKKQRKIQKNLQINDGNASNLQIYKSQKCGTSPKFFLVFSAFGPITWIIFPHTECPKLDPKLPHIALPGCWIFTAHVRFYWRVYA